MLLFEFIDLQLCYNDFSMILPILLQLTKHLYYLMISLWFPYATSNNQKKNNQEIIHPQQQIIFNNSQAMKW